MSDPKDPKDRLVLKDYLRVWASLLRLCWRNTPGYTAAALGVRILGVGFFAGISLALRATVNASQSHLATAAAVGAVGAALAYCADWAVIGSALSLRVIAAEKGGMTELDSSIVRSITGVETLDHLEQPEFLDRVTLLRGASWEVVDSAWASVESLLYVVRLGVVVVLLGSISPWLLLLLAFAAAPLWFDSRGHRLTRAAHTATAAQVRLQRDLLELCTTAGPGKEVRVAGAAPRLLELQAEAWESATRTRFRADLRAALWKAAGWLVYCLGYAAALAFVVSRVRSGHAAVGDVVLGITVAGSLRAAVFQAVQRSSEAAAAGRLLEPYLWLRSYAAEQQALTEAGEREPAPERLREGIELRDVSYTYPGAERPALDGISLHIPAGSVVAVVGEYGSGKSTLVKLLCKFHRPDQGAVLVDGRDLAAIDTPTWRERISSAFQDFGRYHTVLRESVVLGDLTADGDPERVAGALAAADATVLVERLPDGMDTLLGTEFGGTELSEGQWQRLALARASLRPAPLLFVLDEPTASLDAPSEHAIFRRYMERARELAARTGAITVIVSHRFSTVAGADLILSLDRGRLVETGSHEALISQGGAYADLYSLAERGYTGGDAAPPLTASPAEPVT